MKKINYISIILIAFCNIFHAQVKITDGVSNSPTANKDAILELESINKNKGLILPKVSLTATDNPSPIPVHIAGLTVYNTNIANPTAATGVSPGFYYNDGTSWDRLEVQTPSVGDIKYSSVSTDHDGWYLLNGRQITSLPSAAQTNSSSLGFTNTLPNSTDRYLKAKTGTEVLGSTAGNTNITLTQANLPNTAYSASTLSSPTHNHTYSDRASGLVNSSESTTTSVIDNGSATSTTSSAGAHAHTFSIPLGGSGTPLDLEPKYLSTYIFVYLGQ